jgi:hypothetical protein
MTYLARLRRLAEGGLKAEQRKVGKDVDRERQRFWEGYLQALDDIEQHHYQGIAG